jgi:low temperature requirement protein LtrA
MVEPGHKARLRPFDRERRVTFVELFFDVVYVFAVTQCSHLLLANLTWHGALQSLMLLLAVWWAWVYTVWFTNWFDPDHRQVRIAVLAVMFASLIMSAALPEAFGSRGLTFAIAYVALQCGRTGYAAWAQSDDVGLQRNLERVTAWLALGAVPWIVGGLAHGTAREAWWIGALVIDYAAPLARFPTPGLGRSTTADWTIDGSHMAERCQLFVMVALGESILVSGARYSALDMSTPRTLALVVAFLGSVAFWWIYFDRSASWAAGVITESDDPGRLGRSAYTYMHLPMIAGIIVTAVADDLLIRRPGASGTLTVALVTIGGPALFIAGHGLFKYSVSSQVSVARVVTFGLLLAMLPLAVVTPRLVGAAAATAVILAVATLDTRKPT